MKTGQRAHESATLHLRVCEALPNRMRPSTLELCKLLVPEADRGKGYATALLLSVFAEADKYRLTLVLWANPFDGGPLDRNALMAWYERMGFVALPGHNGMMARAPSTLPQLLELAQNERHVP